jgi:hypothetical protein
MRKSVLTTKLTKVTNNSENLYFYLRAPFDVAQDMLRVLRGGNYPLFFGCGYTALGPSAVNPHQSFWLQYFWIAESEKLVDCSRSR